MTAPSPWRSLLPVFAACAAIGLQAGVAMPLVPLALERQGVDKFTIGIVAAGWGLGMLATASHIPRLAARFGTVPFILASVVAGSALTVAYTLTEGPIAWFVLTFLHGAVGGVPWVVSEIWMNVVVEESRRGRVMGIYATMVALGMALGPIVLQVVGV
jgi:MFS family permease